MVPGHRVDAPLAEYWIGSHPKAPSEIELPDGTTLPLDQAIAQCGDTLLGKRCIAAFGPELPFMLKVLSVHPEYGLSIQLHPNKAQAHVLRARAPQHYPDTNHKPEVGIALTPVSLLFGCKSLREVRHLVRALPDLSRFFGADLVERIVQGEIDHDVKLVKELLGRCLTLEEELTRGCVEYLARTLPTIPSLAAEAALLARLLPRYGATDAGLITMLLMNQISVLPGQSIFIGANVPHAYLDGDLVECMASSDNVVRAGLTPKFKDVPALMEIVDCSSELDGVRNLEKDSDGFDRVHAVAAEFCVRVLQHGSRHATVRSGGMPGVVLCIGQMARIRSVTTSKEIELVDGGAAFLPPDSGEYEIETTEAAVFHATPVHTSSRVVR
jgi:mannose-6-phosphate isomerase class I